MLAAPTATTSTQTAAQMTATSTRQLDGRSVLVVYIPSTHESGGPSHWLEALSIGDGSLAVAGRTLVHREGDGR